MNVFDIIFDVLFCITCVCSTVIFFKMTLAICKYFDDVYISNDNDDKEK